ncbi:MAG: NAD-dependent epimerase/dehydratase family protein [Akkermansiaceae bacterium]|nr:NAD-dependent epimerase/dehydratase family protein [Akkermansiaceae bacterium]
MAEYLVTGAAGFIASNVAEMLLRDGHAVVGVDNLNDYYDVGLKEHRIARLETLEGFQFHRLDIEDAGAVADLFKQHRFAAVLNLAARAGVHYSMVNPKVYFTTNTLGTLALLDAVKESGVPKILLASTSSLYAGQEMPFSESLAVNTPISPYAASKKAAELLAHSYHHLYGIDVSVMRYFTVFGPAGRPDMSIFRFIQQIDQGVPLTVYGDGSQSRDFTYVDDIARGTIAALRPLGYEIINIGGGNRPVSIASIIGRIEDLLGKKARIEHKPFHEADLMSSHADISKAKTLLDWEPQIAVEEGLVKTVEWYRENLPWSATVPLT